jgi:hypothetical protein
MGRWEFHTAGHLELYALANLLYPVELQQQLQAPGNKTLDSAHHQLEDKKDRIELTVLIGSSTNHSTWFNCL